MSNMADNSFGNILKVTCFGESHGSIIGVIMDGVPPGLVINTNFIQSELDRRRPGKSNLSSSRSETDKFEIVSGIVNKITTGAPLSFIVKNEDIDSSPYEKFKDIMRPSHADYPAYVKYRGYSDFRGSGRFSGRITLAYVIVGAVAKLILERYNINIFAYTASIGKVSDDSNYSIDNITDLIKKRDNSPVHTLISELSDQMIAEIETVAKEKDSIGGIIKCMIINVPIGVGSPIFNNLESRISSAIFSIPAIKAIEFGAGFKAACMKGSEHNDPWIIKDNKIKTSKNDAGGIIGGLSTGMPIEFSVSVKPTASIGKPQKTVNIKTMKEVELKLEGRHDPCIVPRAVVIVEAMAALVILDELMKYEKSIRFNNQEGF
jgi:chorismate synthase